MAGRLDSRRNDIKLRRKTLRQSVIDERRQTGLLSDEGTPDSVGEPGPRLRTRAAVRAQGVKSEASQKLQERKARQALTKKEVEKARPPFNNYIRVKHTGFSPFKSYQEASKRSRVAPWRAPPPATLVPKTKSCKPKLQSQTAAPAQLLGTSKQPSASHSKHPVPNIRVAPGVVMFGAKALDTAKTAFKPPTKIQPIPFASRATRALVTKTEPEKEKIKIAPKSSAVKRLSPKKLAKSSPKGRFVKKPVVPKPLMRQPVQVIEEPKELPPKTTRPTIIKPRGMKKQLTETERNSESKQIPKRVSRRNVEPSSRTLRSSQSSHNKENDPLQPATTVVKAKVSKRAKKSAAPTDLPAAVVAPPPDGTINDRLEGLQKRRELLNTETERLRRMAEEWSLVKLVSSPPANIADEIDSVVGQTILLTTKKFVQYKGLIEGAYTESRTTLEDLDGFWEMMYIQVKQLDSKFARLSDMKEKNWNVVVPPILLKNVQVREKKKSKPAVKLTSEQSMFRKFLAEKCKKETDAGGTSNETLMDVPPEAARQTVESPLLSMSVDEEFQTPRPSFNFSQRSNTPRTTPVAFENRQRARRSIRFSKTMMRLSSIFQDDSTTT